MEVDHFDPRKKRELIQPYENLFLASHPCNNFKGTTWPSKADLAAGCRFLNCCEEQDYDEQIFEDPDTHYLIGATTAAIWHIRNLDLSAPHLVDERRDRAELRRLLNAQPIRVKPDADKAQMDLLIERLKKSLETMIPDIRPPPVGQSTVA